VSSPGVQNKTEWWQYISPTKVKITLQGCW